MTNSIQHIEEEEKEWPTSLLYYPSHQLTHTNKLVVVVTLLMATDIVENYLFAMYVAMLLVGRHQCHHIRSAHSSGILSNHVVRLSSHRRFVYLFSFSSTMVTLLGFFR